MTFLSQLDPLHLRKAKVWLNYVTVWILFSIRALTILDHDAILAHKPTAQLKSQRLYYPVMFALPVRNHATSVVTSAEVQQAHHDFDSTVKNRIVSYIYISGSVLNRNQDLRPLQT